MKKIHIIRHAKSSWDNNSLRDIERPLNRRGKQSCALMAEAIWHAGCQFEHVFCSPAVRAQSTIKRISKALPQLNIQWQTEPQLYTFSSQDLFDWLSTLDDTIAELLMVAHNPALTDFCNRLSHSHIQNIPTCGYAQLSTKQCLRWLDIATTDFTLTTLLTPKQLATK